MSTNFDKLINKKINENDVSPSNGLWGKIEAELDKKENNKIIIIPFWQHGLFKQIIAASVIFLLGGLTANFLFNGNTTNEFNQFSEKNTLEKQTIVADNNVAININIAEDCQIIESDNPTNPQLNSQASNKLFANKTNSSFNKTNKVNTTNNNLNLTTNTNNQSASRGIRVFNKNSQTKSNSPTNNSFQTNPVASNLNKKNLSASDYNWIYDEETGAYQVVLKQENELLNNSFLINNSVNQNIENSLMAKENNPLNKDSEGKTSMMSLIENEKEEKIETIELTEEEDSYKQFKTKAVKLNYKGFWLGPNAGYESLFAGGEHYPGGSFGVDVGYDFGGSFGLQTGIKYAINAKTIRVNDADGNLVDYKSELNSMHVPFFLRYKFTKLSQQYSKPLSLNFLAGLDYSFMDRKGLHQLGLVAGAEYDMFTQADLMFTVGFRGGVYNNLNKNQVEITEALTLYNYTLSAYIAVRFIDWAKKK